MAGLGESVNFAAVATTVASYKTIASVRAPANQMVQLKGFSAHAAGVAGDAAPLPFRLCRVTAGTGTGTATTPIKTNNGLTCTPQATARVNFSAEPTADGTEPYLYPGLFHPQGGITREVEFNDCWIKEGTELALQVQVPTGGTAVTLTGHLLVEE
jgi:hypothetical protein